MKRETKRELIYVLLEDTMSLKKDMPELVDWLPTALVVGAFKDYHEAIKTKNSLPQSEFISICNTNLISTEVT